MVVSIGKCNDAGYYTDAVAAGRESYYLDAVTAGEPPGVWSGRLAEQVGLVGEVEAEDMKALFSTFTAPDGTQLGRAVPRYRTVEERLAQALESEPDALPERVAQLRAEIEASHRQACLGWDLTASVPKSVTVAHTAIHRAELTAVRSGDPTTAANYARVRAAIEDAIRTANTAAVDYAATLTTARAGRHGARGETARWEAAPDLAVASFFQHTSNSIQPQLHIHNVVLNRAGCADGQIRALDGQDLLAQRSAIGAVFDLALAAELERIGLEVRMRPDGMGREVVGVDQDVCDLFSERRRTISAALAPAVERSEEVLGRSLTDLEVSRLARDITSRTRRGKSHQGESLEERSDRWQAELRAELGKSLDPIARRTRTDYEAALPRDAHPDATLSEAALSEPAQAVRPGQAPGVELWSPSAVIEQAVAAVAEQRATWRRSDLVQEIARAIPDQAGLRAGEVRRLLDQLAERALASAQVVQVAGLPGRPMPEGLKTAAGRPTDTFYAAAGTLAAENALRQAAVLRGRHRVPAGQVRDWLEAHYPSIGADQAAAVVGLASSDAAVAVFVGPAGTGKSFTAGALAAAWSDLAGGGRVIGLAASQNAADVLAADGLQVTANLAAFGTAQRRLADGRPRPGDERLRVGPRDIVLVDEASMISTADLTTVRAVVEAAGARLVLAGDPRQLGSVEAGGVMGLLTNPHPDPARRSATGSTISGASGSGSGAGSAVQAETYTLADVRRFSAGWESQASLALRDGDTNALADYDRHGRILDCPDLEAAIDSAARAVVADLAAGRETLAIADTNDLAARVSVRVRDQLIALGRLPVEASTVSGTGADPGVEPGAGPMLVELGRDKVSAGVGDLIELRRNDRALGVVNRGRGTITAIGQDGSLSVRLAGTDPAQGGAGAGRSVGEVRLPAGYVAEHVSLGYCTTIHGAQGQTVDTGHFVTAGRGDLAALYVALTRGRERNTAHVALTGEPAPGGPQGRPSNTIPAATGAAVLAELLTRTGADAAATVTAETDQAHRANAGTLLAAYEDGVRQVCRNRLESQLDTLTADGHLTPQDRARLCADQGTEHLSRLLRAVEQSGHDPEAVLRAAIEGRKGFADAASVAQVLSARITGPTRIDTPTVEAATAVPAGIPADHASYLADLRADIDHRRHVLGAALAADLAATDAAATDAAATALDRGHQAPTTRQAPGWTTALGQVPTEPVARLEWEDRAGRVAFHREALGWDDPDRALPDPTGVGATERRASWWDAARALGADQIVRDEVAMTDGQLRVRIAAWQREQAWAPPHADRARKTAELDHYEADRDHHLAAMIGDTGAAATTADEREHAAALTRALDQTARVRAEWAAHTATTRATAERAQAEAARRGLILGAEPDRTTAEEFLAADQAARRADDAHRVITEADLYDHERDSATHGTDLHHPADRLGEDAGNAAAAGEPVQARMRVTSAVAGARVVLTDRPSEAELAGAVSAAHAAAAVLADRRSQEAAHEAEANTDRADTWADTNAEAAAAQPDAATASRAADRARSRVNPATAREAATTAAAAHISPAAGTQAGSADAAGL